MSALACRDEGRRQAIRDRGHNGIDYVDVNGTHLCVHFLTDIPREFLPETKDAPLGPGEKAVALRRIVIRGGRRITGLRAMDLDPHATDDSYEQDCLRIDLDREGDWSTYTLCLVELEDGRPTDRPLASLDPRYASVDLSFKLDCPAEVDCKPDAACAPVERPRTAINYLARDYASFRQLILDRLALLAPTWRERHVPDLGLAVVEILAYAADYLTYYQDAVATEAYLDTARRRISVRRHVRLVDYRIHEGCNARVFLALEVARDAQLPGRDLYFVTRLPGLAAPVLREEELAQAPPGWLAFEPLSDRPDLAVWAAHNQIAIYTWGDAECCLVRGATRATLVDAYEEPAPPGQVAVSAAQGAPPAPEARRATRRHPARKTPEPDETCPPVPPPAERPRRLRLRPGDFLLFEELACAGTAFRSLQAGDAGFDGRSPAPDVDRTHRHVVRLTRVWTSVDPLNEQPVLEIEWCREDALPFTLCVSAVGIAPQCDYLEGLAVARGNVVLADHGTTIADEPLEGVTPQETPDECAGEDLLVDVTLRAGRYRPSLRNASLTFAQPLQARSCATSLLRQDPRDALPAITLTSDAPRIHGRAVHETWTARYDLLDRGPDDPCFVAEIDDDRRTRLRFGDGDAGRPVDLGTAFTATYRTGNGRAGLVGPESIAHVVFRRAFNDVVRGVRNPLPSAGAVDPESTADAKLAAPSAFRADLQRAVTGADYGALAAYARYPTRNPAVQGAAGSLVWTGSWYEAGVAVDPLGTNVLGESVRTSIEGGLERVRRMGHDLRVGDAVAVPLRLELDLCVRPDYLRAHVLAALRAALSNQRLPSGRRGFFHPDNLVLGEDVCISHIVAAAMAVEGVAEVEVVRLQRLAHRTPLPAPADGVLPLRDDEVARLDNDPASPENGILAFREVRGGR